MKYRITRFKSLKVCLKEIEPFVRNGWHLQSGKPFKRFDDMRSREILANWLLCVAVNSEIGEDQLTFSSDPIGGDGIIQDIATDATWPTEHVMVPRPRKGKIQDAETLILKAIEHKNNKGGAAYAAGKHLVVFVDADAGVWFPNRVARQLPEPLHFETVWVISLQGVEAGEYIYAVSRLYPFRSSTWRVRIVISLQGVEVGEYAYVVLSPNHAHAPTWRVRISADFESWQVERVQ
jgi:hypothetical protein